MYIPIVEDDYVVVDTETTGGRADTNHIIDIALFHISGGIVVDKFETLINPGCKIPDWIVALTGISDAMVQNAPRFSQVAPTLMKFLEKGTFVAHNAPFDYGFLRAEYERLGHVWERPALCTVKLARKLYPELPSRSLGPLCEHLLIDISNRHRAAGDAEATIYVLKHLLKKVATDHQVHTPEALSKFLKTRPKKQKKKVAS